MMCCAVALTWHLGWKYISKTTIIPVIVAKEQPHDTTLTTERAHPIHPSHATRSPPNGPSAEPQAGTLYLDRSLPTHPATCSGRSQQSRPTLRTRQQGDPAKAKPAGKLLKSFSRAANREVRARNRWANGVECREGARAHTPPELRLCPTG